MMRIETKRTLGFYRNCATRHFRCADPAWSQVGEIASKLQFAHLGGRVCRQGAPYHIGSPRSRALDGNEVIGL